MPISRTYALNAGNEAAKKRQIGKFQPEAQKIANQAGKRGKIAAWSTGQSREFQPEMRKSKK